jgi:hypothetical protein
MSGYHCATCGLTVKVSPAGEITRSCPHDGATVIAERTATLYGEGGASLPVPSLSERVSVAMRTILASVRG